MIKILLISLVITVHVYVIPVRQERSSPPCERLKSGQNFFFFLKNFYRLIGMTDVFFAI